MAFLQYLALKSNYSYLDNKRNITPNFGFGAYYSRERFYAGISAPNLVQNSYSVTNPENVTTLISKNKELINKTQEEWSIDNLKKNEKKANKYFIVAAIMFAQSILIAILGF